MKNLLKMIYLGERISEDLSYVVGKNEGNNNYQTLVKELIYDYYYQQRNGYAKGIVLMPPSSPKRIIEWLQKPIENLVMGVYTNKDLEGLESLKDQPILLEDLSFNPVFYELIEGEKRFENIYLESKSIEKLLNTIWEEDISFIDEEGIENDYTMFRTFLSKKENAVVGSRDLEQLDFKSFYKEEFYNALQDMYEDIPSGSFYHCEYCGWTVPKGQFNCLHKRCKSFNMVVKNNLRQVSKEKRKRMKRGVVVFVLIPGMFELSLKETIIKKAGFIGKIKMYPGIEKDGDILYDNGSGKTYYLDCKDYSVVDRLIQVAREYVKKRKNANRIFVYPHRNNLSKLKINKANEELLLQANVKIMSDKEFIKEYIGV